MKINMLYKSQQVWSVFIAKLFTTDYVYHIPVEQWDAMMSLPQNYSVPYQMAEISYLQSICWILLIKNALGFFVQL